MNSQVNLYLQLLMLENLCKVAYNNTYTTLPCIVDQLQIDNSKKEVYRDNHVVVREVINGEVKAFGNHPQPPISFPTSVTDTKAIVHSNNEIDNACHKRNRETSLPLVLKRKNTYSVLKEKKLTFDLKTPNEISTMLHEKAMMEGTRGRGRPRKIKKVIDGQLEK
ncbi:hypothetical protein ABK040_014924 [Willaertia magna]